MDTLAPLWSLLSTFRGLGQKMELGLIKSFLLAKPYAQISYLTRSFFFFYADTTSHSLSVLIDF
jgi:hypothetical protein